MKNSIDVSLPQGKTVCGYEIKKMPLGAFLKAVRLLQDTPKELIDAMYPGEGLEGMLARLKTMDKDGLQALIMRALCVLPDKVIALFSQLSGISESKLTGDANIGLDGLMEMMLAWIEVNGIENFIKGVRTIRDQVRTLTMRKDGSNG